MPSAFFSESQIFTDFGISFRIGTDSMSFPNSDSGLERGLDREPDFDQDLKLVNIVCHSYLAAIN